MTDYTKSTGNTGTMRIRDTDGKIEFWLKAGSSTYNYQLGWGYTVNGTTDNSNEFRFVTGGDWQKVKTWTVSSSQTVTFRLKDSGTNGLGGPTTLSASIKRASYPDPPSKPSVTNVTSNSVYVTFSDGDNNGASIDSRQIQYGTTSPIKIISSDRSTTITGLTSGTKWYFRARTHNSEGYSAWTAYTGVTTLDEPAAPGVVQLSSITQTSMVAVFADPSSTGGTPITDRQVGYSLTTGTPTTTVTYSGPTTIAHLKPATLYYFSSRTKNSVGWSTWSSPRTATTLAGAYIKVGGVWKKAVPYVRVAGVWKVARPWGRQFGYWEEST